MKNVLAFIKNEAVLIISFMLAVVSAFIVTPSKQYIDYIDFRTLALLFCLMAVMAGFNAIGLFKIIAQGLLGKVKGTRGLAIILNLLCFFLSMIITNDVALITFVPFTIIIMTLSKKEGQLPYIVVLETISANLGSMLTPLGNPQNLYIYSYYGLGIIEFFKTIIPYASLSFVIIIACCMAIKNEPAEVNNSDKSKIDSRMMALYIVLFIIALLSVFRVINYIISFAITILAMLIIDRKNIKRIDYSLLLTFVFLFIFIGNLGHIDAISDYLHKIVIGHEVLVGIASSQVFSNVPAAILLSGFTDNARDLLIGVNIGGLGTLIASMASLISFKFIQKEKTSTSKYFILFTIMNILFLIANIGLWMIIR